MWVNLCLVAPGSADRYVTIKEHRAGLTVEHCGTVYVFTGKHTYGGWRIYAV